MNYLLMVVLGLLFWSTFDGYRKGFMKTVFALVAWIIVLVVCNVATPMVTDFLIEETSIAEDISGILEEKMNEVIEESGINDLEENIPEELSSALSGQSGGFEGVLNSTSVVYTIIGVIAVVLVIVVTRIMIMVIDIVLGIAAKLPLIGPLDKLLGFACGAAKGILLCWIVLAIAPMVRIPDVNMNFAAYIEDSQFLILMQQYNLILRIFGAGQLFV